MGNAIAMFEVVSTDPGRAVSFYTGLFGWTAGPEFAGFTLSDTGAGEGAVGAGIGPSYGETDTGVKVYVKVDDLDEAIKKAESLGGNALVPPTSLPDGYGTFAVVSDVDGNPVGLWL
jgi:hypothetical protein